MTAETVDPRETALIGLYLTPWNGRPPLLFLPGGTLLSDQLDRPLCWKLDEDPTHWRFATAPHGTEDWLWWNATPDPITGQVYTIMPEDLSLEYVREAWLGPAAGHGMLMSTSAVASSVDGGEGE